MIVRVQGGCNAAANGQGWFFVLERVNTGGALLLLSWPEADLYQTYCEGEENIDGGAVAG